MTDVEGKAAFITGGAPGIGRGILESINSRDITLLTAQVLVLCGVFVVINAIVDIVQPFLDPRQVTR